jgi:hypothetical protein
MILLGADDIVLYAFSPFKLGEISISELRIEDEPSLELQAHRVFNRFYPALLKG